jgi:hypothetical protein
MVYQDCGFAEQSKLLIIIIIKPEDETAAAWRVDERWICRS